MLWLLAILVGTRVALSIALVPFAEKSLSRLLGARVRVGDVSFAPIDAVVTLRDVAVRMSDDSAEAAPAVAAGRVRIDVQWLPLVHRALVVRELALESGRVDLERLRGAGWTLERLQHVDPASVLPDGWSFVLERIVLRDTRIRSRDVTPGDLTVRDARVSTRPSPASAFRRAPNLRVDAVADGGRLLIVGSSDLRDDGVAVDARVDLKDVPLDRLGPYRPAVAASSLAGQVSGRLHYQRDPGRRERLSGRLRGRQVAVHVPTLAEPALSVRRLEVGVDGIDLLQRRIAIGTATLYGARLVVRPDPIAPVPLLDGVVLAADEPVESRAARTARWTWTIGRLASPFARVIVAGAGEERSLAAEVSGENVGPGAYWSPLRARVAWVGGAVAFDGTARMTHGFDLEGRLTAHDVDVPAVASAVGPKLATLVQAGRGAADLDVELATGDAKRRSHDGRGRIDATDQPLDVRGKISVADLWIAGPDPDAFAVGARAVDLELAGVAPAQQDDGSRTAELRFATAAVESPYVQLTRTAEGWSALPAAPDAPERPASPLAIAVADAHARNGRVLVADASATPNVALDLDAVEGWARQLGLPAVGVAEFALQGIDRRLGALRIAGAGGATDLRAELSVPAVRLPALAPYLQRAGLPYAFTSGTGAVRAALSLGGDQWSADAKLTLVDPALGGDEAMLERSLGMTPEAAFAALRERQGDVSLQLALGSAGWTGGRALNETVAGAVRDALARPRLAPLPDVPLEVAFGAGRNEPGPSAMRELGSIADVLAARPDVMVELRGAVSRVDRRWLAEQAVAMRQAAEPDEPGGLKGLLRAVGFRDQRIRIRDALADRAAGEPGRLRADDQAALDELVAAGPPIADDRLVSLAADRATLVAKLLADAHGVAAARVVVAEPTVPEAAPVVEARFVPMPEPSPW